MSEILGKIEVIKDTVNVSATFKKREFVVTTQEQFPQSILLELNKDKCDLLNNFKVGDEVNVSYNLRGRAWQNPQGETKYFNTIQAWKISKTEEVNNSAVEDYQAKAEPETDTDLPW